MSINQKLQFVTLLFVLIYLTYIFMKRLYEVLKDMLIRRYIRKIGYTVDMEMTDIFGVVVYSRNGDIIMSYYLYSLPYKRVKELYK